MSELQSKMQCFQTYGLFAHLPLEETWSCGLPGKFTVVHNGTCSATQRSDSQHIYKFCVLLEQVLCCLGVQPSSD